MVTKLIVVRHFQAEGNLNSTFQGTTDTDLSEIGIRQAEMLKKRFETIPVDLVYTSPLKRAVKTADAIVHSHDVPVIRWPNLSEINAGEWEGLSWREITVHYPREHRIWREEPQSFQSPGGESIRDVYRRVCRAAEEIVNENPGKTIALVSHGCAIRCLTCWASGKSISHLGEIPFADNGGIMHIQIDENGIRTITGFNNCVGS